MSNTRRSFLTRLLGGSVAVAGTLLLPSKLLAGRRGRRQNVCCPPPICPLPVVCPTPVGHIQPTAQNPVTIFYPPCAPGVTGYTIPGLGGFYSWGKYGTGASNIQVVATDQNCTKLPTQPRIRVPSQIPAQSDWAFVLDNYANQTNFYLCYSWTLNMNQSSIVCGPFST